MTGVGSALAPAACDAAAGPRGGRGDRGDGSRLAATEAAGLVVLELQAARTTTIVAARTAQRDRPRTGLMAPPLGSTSGRPRVSGPTATSSRPMDPVSRWPFPAQPHWIDVGRLHAKRRDDRRASLSSGAGASPTPTSDHAHPLYSPWQLDSSSEKFNVVNDRHGCAIKPNRAWPSIDAATSSTHNRRTMSHTTNGRRRTPVSDDRRPTMHDVADLAGVSLKTVSRVFNHEPNVRPAVRARVESAAVSLGFRRNIIAKNLRTGSATSSVGLVIADLLNPFYGAIATAVEAVANRHSATMILGSSAEDVIREQRIVTDLLEGHVDGLIVVPTGGDHSYLEPQRRLGVHVVFVDRPASGIEADAVVLDNVGGARSATRHLLNLGHRPDRVRRRLGDPGDGAGAAGRLSAGPRRSRGRVRSGARPVRCAADRAGRDRRPAAARERRPADRDLRREQPQLHRRHPGGDRHRPTGRRRRLRRLRAGRPARRHR